jgi:hypothetical protein
MKYLFSLFVCIYAAHAIAQGPVQPTRSVPVIIQWVDGLKGDFSFRKKWEYPPDVVRNDHGQLIFEGGDPTVDSLLDSKGRIPKKLLGAYYRIVDTAHMYHSLSAEGHSYEFLGADYAEAEWRHDTLHCYTLCSGGHHSSLNLFVVKDTCYATIRLRGMRTRGNLVYYCYRGYMKIDKAAWAENTLKAEFSFDFTSDMVEPPMFWKGLLYKKIEPAKQNLGFWDYSHW